MSTRVPAFAADLSISLTQALSSAYFETVLTSELRIFAAPIIVAEFFGFKLVAVWYVGWSGSL